MKFGKIYNIPEYQEELEYLTSLSLPWEKLKNTTVLISGATGMLGSLLTDVIILAREKYALNCSIIALGRSWEKMQTRFSHWDDFWGKAIYFMQCDINQPFDSSVFPEKIDYIVHLASNTHPLAYATDPIGTIMANVVGTKNLLDCAVKHTAQRFAFASSNEIYGENLGDQELFDENYCGYINCNTLRAGYPESKRCGEALCQAYRKQYGLNIVIPRFTRSYGPTLLGDDSKAFSQFLRNALGHEDIVLKSEGLQYYSYTYAADAISGFLTVLLKGEDGEAYNIADEASDVRLKDLAQCIATVAETHVVFELPNAVESAGFSKATKARLDASKLKHLGWHANWTIETGVKRTIGMLKSIIVS